MSENQKTEITGQIFNIQRFSIHDGPGIRTTVFLKGCPLRCFWCQNPESQLLEPVLLYSRKSCVGCLRCIPTCKVHAIRIDDSGEERKVKTDRNICRNCGVCTKVCPAEARSMAGYTITLEDLMKELMKDESVYLDSGGGITVSGGDPLYQASFTRSILQAAREEYISTAIETSGYAGWEVFRPIAELSDFIYMDLKQMDDKKHIQGTGISNRVILENAVRLVEMGKDVHFRMPLIPGFNDDEESVIALRRFAEDRLHIGADRLELLKYNKLSEDKDRQLEKEGREQETQTDEYFEYLKELLQ